MIGTLLQRRAGRPCPLPASLWRLTRDHAGFLTLDGTRLQSLIEEYGSPLHVVDAQKLDENCGAFLQRPAGCGRGCEIYYSYKTNPVPGVLQHLHRRGIGAEVVSEYELWLALQLGTPPESIVYNGPVKSDASLETAIQQGIQLINFNCREEITRCAAIARRIGKRPRVGIRIVASDGWGGQLGESVPSGAATAAFREALSTPELDVVALHVHQGGEITSASQVQRLVGGTLAFADRLRTECGLELEVLDFGGSMACPTASRFSSRELRLNRTFRVPLAPRPPEAVLSIDDYVAEIVRMVESHYRALCREAPRIFLEPGRAMTGNTQMLLCQVLMTRTLTDGLLCAVLDAGINIAQPVCTEYHEMFVVGPTAGEKDIPYRLAGPIPSPADVLCWARELPTLSPGAALAIMDTGAYFVPFATSFSFPQPPIVLCNRGKHSLIRRAESFEDRMLQDCLPTL